MTETELTILKNQVEIMKALFTAHLGPESLLSRIEETVQVINSHSYTATECENCGAPEGFGHTSGCPSGHPATAQVAEHYEEVDPDCCPGN